MSQGYPPPGEQPGNTCRLVQADILLWENALFLDPVNNRMLGDHQRQLLLRFKPCQLAVLISRVTLSIITNNWCDFKHKWLTMARGAISRAQPRPFPPPEPAGRTAALAAAACPLPPASP